MVLVAVTTTSSITGVPPGKALAEVGNANIIDIDRPNDRQQIPKNRNIIVSNIFFLLSSLEE
jgi:hypothetical protein